MKASMTQTTALTSKSAIVSRLLESKHEIETAQRLIYQVFVEEMQWIPDIENPSGIRFFEDQKGKRFVDYFDENAIWFGTFHHQTLIACWRFCEPRNGKFELEHYHPIPNFLKASKSLKLHDLLFIQNIVENRESC
jgi:hypothetical protein